jgi:hypothetical protein
MRRRQGAHLPPPLASRKIASISRRCHVVLRLTKDGCTRRLLETFEAASGRYGRFIHPAGRCGPLDIPINAMDGGEDGVDISLSRLDDPTPGTRRERLADIAKLRNCQEDRNFRPLVLMVSPDDTELKQIDGLEDVTKGKFQPEDVTASSSPVEFVEVNR